jgi:DNA-binding PadR family transcriptional regulator
MADPSAKLTPLGVMVLALLREGDMHPYEMMRLMRHRRDDRLVPIQNGTFYHTVGRLQRAGLLAEIGVDRDGNRPERTTYTVTDSGREVVLEWVRRELPRTDRPAEFRVALAEAHNLPREEVADLLATRRASLAANLEMHTRGLADADLRGVPQQYLVEVDREAALLESELAWLDRLRARLTDNAMPWGIADIPEETLHRLIALREAQTS